MTRRIVLLGTGTGVGKTYFGARLAESLLRQGFATLALKPIESGVAPDAGELTDAARLASASGRGAEHCYALPEPLSPHLAARRAGVSIDLARVASWVREHEEAQPHLDFTLVESAGGALSPVSEKATNFDLARALEPAIWVLVAPDALGVLHDVRATLLALEALGRRPDHVVLCQARPLDTSSGTNAAELERLGVCRVSALLARGGEATHELGSFLTIR